MKLTTRLGGVLVASLLAVAGLAACSTDNKETPTEQPTSTSNTTWPLTFTNADGTTTEIKSKPERILSTSVSITGTLLAIDAPVIASGAAGNGKFFAQWAGVAEKRKVQNLWAAGNVDIEAVIAANPDLIVVSTSGADSAMDQLAELKDVAPTIVLNYSSQTWQELATQVSTALGIEDKAKSAIDEFNAKVADAKTKITVPKGKANIISYNGAGKSNPIGKNTGPHAQLLTSLGFTIEEPDAKWHSQNNTRSDFVMASFENLTELTADTTFLLAVGDEKAANFVADPVLANLPSVQNKQVYGLGPNSFRIDMFSSTEIVNHVLELFAK